MSSLAFAKCFIKKLIINSIFRHDSIAMIKKTCYPLPIVLKRSGYVPKNGQAKMAFFLSSRATLSAIP